MTREETIKVLAILKAAYPASYKGMTKQEASGTVMVWATQFANVPGEVVLIAVQKLISSSNFPPSISEVKSKLRGLYWESWHIVNSHKQGVTVMDNQTLARTEAIMNACRGFNDSASQEPKLEDLLGGVQRYLLGE